MRLIDRKLFKAALLSLALAVVAGCGGNASGDGSSQGGKAGSSAIKNLNSASPDADQFVLVETNLGDIKIKLYRETPLHRQNFVNLVMNGFYDNQLFFRVMKDFLVQAGDPDTRNAQPGDALGAGEVNYKIKAEIQPDKFYHKRGAISAASLNPMRLSSGCQFYIITGKKVGDDALNSQEKKIDKGVRKVVYEDLQEPYKETLNKLYAESKKDKSKKKELNNWIHRFTAMTDSVLEGRNFKYSAEQRRVYKTQGGAAHLDGSYTVFGEVVEGMEVVDSMTYLRIDVRNRPTTDVVIKKMTLLNE